MRGLVGVWKKNWWMSTFWILPDANSQDKKKKKLYFYTTDRKFVLWILLRLLRQAYSKRLLGRWEKLEKGGWKKFRFHFVKNDYFSSKAVFAKRICDAIRWFFRRTLSLPIFDFRFSKTVCLKRKFIMIQYSQSWPRNLQGKRRS